MAIYFLNIFIEFDNYFYWVIEDVATVATFELASERHHRVEVNVGQE